MTKKLIAGGCSFTFGHELSDDNEGKVPSNKTWAAMLDANKDYVCVAKAGSGNSGIARRVFTAVSGFDKDTISRLGSGTKQKPLCGFVKTKTLK